MGWNWRARISTTCLRSFAATVRAGVGLAKETSAWFVLVVPVRVITAIQRYRCYSTAPVCHIST
jgi:hypothetical protein